MNGRPKGNNNSGPNTVRSDMYLIRGNTNDFFFSCYFTFDFFEKDIFSHLFLVTLYVLSPDLLGIKNTAVALFYMINGTDIIVFSLVFMYWRSADIW